MALVADGGQGHNYTYGEIESLVANVSAGLKAGGLEPGDRLGILSENRPEWPLAYLAILAAGGVVVPIDASLKSTELTFLMRASKIKSLFCSEKLYQTAADICALNDLKIKLIILDAHNLHSLKSLAGDTPFVASDTRPDDAAVIIYTSGTTGDPKGVVLTHRNIVSDLKSISYGLDIYDDDTFLSILPLHHTFEATCGFLFPLLAGLKIVYGRSLKSRDLVNDIKSNRITCMVAVPILYEKMYAAIYKKIREMNRLKKISFKSLYSAAKLGWKINRPVGRKLFRSLREKAGLSSIRMFVSGGAPLPPEVAEWFNLVGFSFLQGYGLTECSPVVSVNHISNPRFDSVGPPLPGIKVDIDDPSPDGIGEIKIQGGNVTPGYIDNPDATADLIRNDWLYTGDMGKIHKGHLYITGRKKSLIVTGGGKNVYPEQIEAELNLSQCILESLVLGRKKPDRAGEEIWALIVPDMEQIKAQIHDPSASDIRHLIKHEIDTVNDRLAGYKRITQFEIRLEEFVKTSTRKIKRHLYSRLL